MPVDVKIPPLGESITEAEIVRWLKANGDEVEVDEPIAEIETDKATAELPAPASGILEIVAKEGSTVKPGDVVARIREGKAEAKSGKPSTRDSVREAEPAPATRPTTATPSAQRPAAPVEKRSPAAGERQTPTAARADSGPGTSAR